MRRLLTLILTAVLLCALLPKTAQAASKSISYKGLTLTPAIENVELAPGESQISFKIKVENKQTTDAGLTLSSLDFKSLNETGGVAFIGSSAGSLEHKYGLANWLQLPGGTIELPPGGSREITVTVQNRDDLSPGGHYAAVLFKNSAAGGSGANHVDVNQVVSVLVFLKKSGGEQYGLALKDFRQPTAWFGLPSSLPLLLRNTGNTQTVPRGIVSIEDSNGQIYSRGQINVNSGLVLPESTRFFRTPLYSVGHAWLPGTYKIVISYRPEDVAQAQTAEFSFFYIGIFSWLALAAFLLTPIGILYWRNYRSWR